MIQPVGECEIKSSGSHTRPQLALTGYNSSPKYTGSLKTAAGDQGESPGRDWWPAETGFVLNPLGRGEGEVDTASVCDEN